MRIWQVIERSLSQRKLSSVLTALNVALGVMLVSAILTLQREMEETYRRPSRGYQLVVGPTGSALQIVLNTVFHVDQSPGLIPYSIQKEFEDNPRDVRLAIPYAVGDSFRGFRVVATTNGIFSPVFPHPPGDVTKKLARGRPFKYSDHALQHAFESLVAGTAHEHEGHRHTFEAVVGWEVADKLGLKLGDRIEPTHGVEGEEEHDHEHLWDVVGVLKRSGTPVDRVVFINLDSFYWISDHAGAKMPISNEPAISSILLFPRRGVAQARLLPQLTKRSDLQVANVALEVKKLLSIVGQVDVVFLVTAVLVVVIGIVSIMVAIYNTMSERRREIAILRAIGARRRFVVAAIVGESTALAFIGGVFGVLMAHLAMFLARDKIIEIAGLAVEPSRFLPIELLLVAAVTVVGALAGLIPALKAYNTDVARNLAPLS